MSDKKTIPTLFWVISILALLWNILGVVIYFGTVNITEAALISNYGETGAAVFLSRPAWATGAFAIAVFGGVLGCIGLLLRKSWAYYLFIVSLLAFVVYEVWEIIIAKFYQYMPASESVPTIMVFFIAVFMVWFSKKKISKGILT